MSARSRALLGCLLASACYHGSARTATPSDLADQNDSWNLVEGVSPVRQIARQDHRPVLVGVMKRYGGRVYPDYA